MKNDIEKINELLISRIIPKINTIMNKEQDSEVAIDILTKYPLNVNFVEVDLSPMTFEKPTPPKKESLLDMFRYCYEISVESQKPGMEIVLKHSNGSEKKILNNLLNHDDILSLIILKYMAYIELFLTNKEYKDIIRILKKDDSYIEDKVVVEIEKSMVGSIMSQKEGDANLVSDKTMVNMFMNLLIPKLNTSTDRMPDDKWSLSILSEFPIEVGFLKVKKSTMEGIEYKSICDSEMIHIFNENINFLLKEEEQTKAPNIQITLKYSNEKEKDILTKIVNRSILSMPVVFNYIHCVNKYLNQNDYKMIEYNKDKLCHGGSNLKELGLKITQDYSRSEREYGFKEIKNKYSEKDILDLVNKKEIKELSNLSAAQQMEYGQIAAHIQTAEDALFVANMIERNKYINIFIGRLSYEVFKIYRSSVSENCKLNIGEKYLLNLILKI